MRIRHALPSDLNELSEIESACFPPLEAASKEKLRDRLNVFPNHFWVLENEGAIIGFVNGMVVNDLDFSDDWFEYANLHDENGKWQAVFGLNVLPEYRRNGYAAKLLEALIEAAKHQKRKGSILTCKEHLVHYYEKFGYKRTGISDSTLGSATWYNMVLIF